MKAMIFAAGLGTRLKPFTDCAPKALATVNNKTLLEHTIKYLQQYGIYDVIINVHHFADMIKDVLLVNAGFGSNITISDEKEAVLETGGGLKKAGWYFNNEPDFLVINVDVFTNLDLEKLIDIHRAGNQVCTLAVMKRPSARQLLFDNEMTLCGWSNEKTGEKKISRAVIALNPFSFSGIQIVSNAVWEHSQFDGKFSLIDLYLEVAKTRVIRGYDHTGDIFIDVGKPESLALASQMFH